MYSFEFYKINELTDINELVKGCYICIWHAHKIPPHIGILIDGLYFSLKVKGKDIAIPAQEIVKVIQRKNICSVFVEIKNEVDLRTIKYVFSNYEKAEKNNFTCLTPITEVFELNDEVHLLGDLLNYFKQKQQIGKLFGLNLIPDFKGIQRYGKAEIEARLEQLSKSN